MNQNFYVYCDFTVGSGISRLTVAIVRIKITDASATVLTRRTSTVVNDILTPCVSIAIRAYAKKLTWTSVNTSGSVSAYSLITFVDWYWTIDALITSRANTIVSAYWWNALSWILTWIGSAVVYFNFTIDASITNWTHA